MDLSARLQRRIIGNIEDCFVELNHKANFLVKLFMKHYYMNLRDKLCKLIVDGAVSDVTFGWLDQNLEKLEKSEEVRDQVHKAITKYNDTLSSSNEAYVLNRIKRIVSSERKKSYQPYFQSYDDYNLLIDPRIYEKDFQTITKIRFKSAYEARLIAITFAVINEHVLSNIVKAASSIKSDANHKRKNSWGHQMISAQDLTKALLSFPEYVDVIRDHACFDSDWSISLLRKSISDPETVDPFFLGSLNQKIKVEEDTLRRKFITERDLPGSDIQNPHVLLIDVYQNVDKFIAQVEDSDEAKIEKLLAKNRLIQTHGTHAIVHRPEFDSNWNALTCGILNGLDWSSVFVAGGSILGCVMPNFQLPINFAETAFGKGTFIGFNGFQDCDIDLFLYDLDVSSALKKVDHIISVVETNTKKPAVILRSKYALTICGVFPNRNIQVILRLYKSPAEVLIGFDIDCCCVGFDGTTVWCLPRAHRAITKAYNLVDLTRRSLTYEKRLFKYSVRGWAVAVPGLDRNRVDLLKAMDAEGLGKLIRYDMNHTRHDRAIRAAVFYHSLIVKHEPKSGLGFRFQRASRNKDRKPLTDYLTPAARGFHTADELENMIGVTNDDGSAYIVGYKELVLSDTSSSSSIGKLEFVTDNPGRQLLSGSFHPIDDDKWYSDSYCKDGFVFGVDHFVSNTKKDSIFSKFLGNDKYTDISFSVQGEIIKANKLLLSGSSPVFEALLYGQFKEHEQIELPDISPAAFRNVLHFIYTNQVPELDSDNILDTLYASIKYEIPELQRSCSNFLYNNVTEENALSVLSLVYLFENTPLYTKCMSLVTRNADQCLQSETFQQLLDTKLIQHIVKSDQFQPSPSVLEDAALKWARAWCPRNGITAEDHSIRKVISDVFHFKMDTT